MSDRQADKGVEGVCKGMIDFRSLGILYGKGGMRIYEGVDGQDLNGLNVLVGTRNF